MWGYLGYFSQELESLSSIHEIPHPRFLQAKIFPSPYKGEGGMSAFVF